MRASSPPFSTRFAIANQADEMPDLIDDRQSSKSLSNQSLDRRASWCVGTYRMNVVCHHVADLQIETHLPTVRSPYEAMPTSSR